MTTTLKERERERIGCVKKALNNEGKKEGEFCAIFYSLTMISLKAAFSRGGGGGGFGGRHHILPWCFGRKAGVVFWEWRGALETTKSSSAMMMMRYVATTSFVSSGNTSDAFDATTTLTQRRRSAVASKNDFVDDGTQKSTTTSKRHKSPTTTLMMKKTKELGGPKGLEPTRFTDWEVGGRCTDF